MPSTIDNKKNSSANPCAYCCFNTVCTAEGGHKPDHSFIVRTRHFASNEALCVMNSKFQSIYVIKKGAVKAYQVDINGYEHIHAFYFSGESLGFRAIHTGHYVSTVVALTDTIVCDVPYHQFIVKLKTNPELYKSFFSLVSKQLTASAYVDTATAEQRIAAFIIDLSLRADSVTPPLELTLPMSRNDIGNYLRLTAETVSRVLSRLHKQNIIHTNRKFIRIENLAKLKQLAQ